MKKISVEHFQEKDKIETVLLVKEKHLNMGKTGKPYLSVLLSDKTGQIDGRVWDNADDLNKKFDDGDLSWVQGVVQVFQGRKQIIIRDIQKVQVDDYDIKDFLPASDNSSELMYVELLQFVDEVENSHLRQLLENTVNDKEIKPLLLKAPAAKNIHHAWIGGLLDHTMSILKIMKFLSSHYQTLNRDLLYFGAIYHDIGKVWELSYGGTTSYTDKGRLIGHMGIALELIDRKSNHIEGFSDELRDICKHIVLSHHGKLEFGSPKRPKFLEALVVSMVDELDSRINILEGFMKDERKSGEKWSRYNSLFDRYFLLTDFTEKL